MRFAWRPVPSNGSTNPPRKGHPHSGCASPSSLANSEQGSSRGYDDERIVGNDVRPLCRNGLEAAMAVREVHPIFVPTLAAVEENEPLTVQRMKRVRDLHPPLIVVITCS
jgi:hypothetical protein